jgi:hypothetical protein
MIAFHSGKSAHRARGLSTGHDSMRSDVPLASQIARQFIISDAIDASFKSRFTVGPLAGSAGSQSHTPIRGTQIPIAPAAPHSVP